MEKIKGKKQWAVAILCGIVIGFINGFFGGGGGMICVPVLEQVLKIETKKAHATTIAIILPLSLVSSIIYAVSNNIDYLELLYVTLGVCAGGILGAFLLKKLNSKIVRIIFVAIMMFAGIMLIVR